MVRSAGIADNGCRPPARSRIFEGRYAKALPGVASDDVSPDASRFLMVKPGAEEAEPRRLRFVLNWARGL
jgi:hypothetical protein